MKILCMVVAALLAASPLLGDSIQSEIRITTVSGLPSCTAARDGRVYVVTDGTSTTDCATGSSTEVSVCVCSSGSWASVASGGSGTSVILDLADDGTNESTALAEIAVTNDTRSAFTEPSANKLLIDVSKLRRLSFDNEPASPHAYDCEFTSGVCAGWSTTFAGGSGTVDVTTAPATEIYDTATWPGWLLMQHQNASGKYEGVYKESLTIGTDATLHASLRSIGARSYSTATEGEYYIEFYDSGDLNESALCGVTSGGNASVEGRLCVQNDGAFTCGFIASPNNRDYAAPSYFTLMKDGNDYYCWIWWNDMGPASHIGPQTKTGVTTMNSARAFTTSDNLSQAVVYGLDFIRFYDSATIALGNP